MAGNRSDAIKQAAKIASEKAAEFIGSAAVKAGDIAGAAAVKAGEVAGTAGSAIVRAGKTAAQKAVELKDYIPSIKLEDILKVVMKAPIVQIDREQFLSKELTKHCSEETIRLAIEKNPAYAGIERETINKIASNVIKFETNKVTAISFATGLPGGTAMLATVPADIAQLFTYILRTMQKLAYLYGFPEFKFSEDEVDDETLNLVLVFMGVMFGVQGAGQAVKALSKTAAQKVTKTLAEKALTKTTIYPIVKKIAAALGIKMTKQLFAESVGKVIPVVGGAVAGGLTYATFKPGCVKLQNSFNDLELSDPEYYKNLDAKQESDFSHAVDVDFEFVEEGESVSAETVDTK